jgi:hypothetical protein
VSDLSKEVCIKCTEPIDHSCCKLLFEGPSFLFRGERVNAAARMNREKPFKERSWDD